MVWTRHFTHLARKGTETGAFLQRPVCGIVQSIDNILHQDSRRIPSNGRCNTYRHPHQYPRIFR